MIFDTYKGAIPSCHTTQPRPFIPHQLQSARSPPLALDETCLVAFRSLVKKRGRWASVGEKPHTYHESPAEARSSTGTNRSFRETQSTQVCYAGGFAPEK